MREGQYAVLFQNRQPASVDTSLGPVAVLFADLASAERYARGETVREPYIRCNIYDSHGMGRPPLLVIAGAKGEDKSFLSARFRRWVGGGCFAVGVVLGSVEWWSGFTLTWPGVLGSRIGPAGAILLLTEAGVMLTERWKTKQG